MDPPPIYQPQPPQVAAGAYSPAPANNSFMYSAYSTPNYSGIPVNQPAHPSYPTMITEAITRLMEIPKVRTSKKEIAQCIAATYGGEIPPSHMRVVAEYLKRMTDLGQLVRVGNSYLFPAGADAGSENPQPPAPVAAPAPAAASAPAVAASSSGGAGSSILKKRGRPPKAKPSPEPLAASGEAQEVSAALVNGAESSAKKRGRPRKVRPDPVAAGLFSYQEPQPEPQPQVAVYDAAPVSVFNGVAATPVLVNGSASLPKRRGRPRKDGSATPVAQPASAVASVVKSSSGRRRGRPRKYPIDMAAVPLSSGRPRGRPRRDAVAGGPALLGMKRRGRPRGSVAGARRLLVGRTGRPLGRPRKYPLAAEAQASDVRAKEELTRKLEYMQIKVRSAVGLLKPHLINANILDIMSALQDLEELSTMDITVPAEAPLTLAPVSEPPAPAEPSAPPAEPPAPSYAAYAAAPSQPPPPAKVDTALGMSG